MIAVHGYTVFCPRRLALAVALAATVGRRHAYSVPRFLGSRDLGIVP